MLFETTHKFQKIERTYLRHFLLTGRIGLRQENCTLRALTGLLPPLAYPVEAWFPTPGPGDWTIKPTRGGVPFALYSEETWCKSALPSALVVSGSFLAWNPAGLRAAGRSVAPGWVPFVPWTSWHGPVLPPSKFPGGADQILPTSYIFSPAAPLASLPPPALQGC
jgi:hypothetical protein